MSDWVEMHVGPRVLHGDPSAIVRVTVRCECGRKTRHTRTDKDGFYCRRHGLKAYLTPEGMPSQPLGREMNGRH